MSIHRTHIEIGRESEDFTKDILKWVLIGHRNKSKTWKRTTEDEL